MEPLARAKRLVGDQKGSPGSKVITSEVPDKPKRLSTKGGGKPKVTAPEFDFSDEKNESEMINLVDTDQEGLDVQAANEIEEKANIIKENELIKLQEAPITLASLTSGIHEAKEILDLINLIKSTGKQDADGLWHPIPDSDFPWSSRLVDEIFQLGDEIKTKAADLVIDGRPCRQYHGDDDNDKKVNSSVLISSSSASTVIPKKQTELQLTQEVLLGHEGRHPSAVKSNIRPPTPEKDRKATPVIQKQMKGVGSGRKFTDGGDLTPKAVRKYVNNYPNLLPECVPPDEQNRVPLGNIPPPVQRGSISRRMRSILESKEHPAVLQWIDVPFSSQCVKEGSKILSHELYGVVEELKRKNQPLPSNNTTVQDVTANPELLRWMKGMSIKSSFIQALLCCRVQTFNLLGEVGSLEIYTEQKGRQRKLPYKRDAIISQSDKNARQIIGGIDVILHDIAGPEFQDVRWQPTKPWLLMASDVFKRLLYAMYADFLRSERVDVEREYPWIVRYTEDIREDAPSQLPLYYQHTKALTHRPVTQRDMLAAHRQFVPYHPELTLDLESTVDQIDQSSRDYERRYSESSGQGTSNERSSDNNDINMDLENQFMQYDNPVVQPPAPLTPLMSDVHISGLQQRRTPLKVTDLTTSKAEEKAKLLQRLQELEDEDRPPPRVSFSQPVDQIPKQVTGLLRYCRIIISRHR